MFDSLSSKLQKITSGMRGKARVTDQDINDMMKEIRMALLEADVNYSVVKSFVADMSEKCKNAEIQTSITPGQQIVKIVHESLVELLGTGEEKIFVSPSGFTVIILYGLQGAGKTTTAVKLATLLKGDSKKPMVASVDVHRPAAATQLKILADAAKYDVACTSSGSSRRGKKGMLGNTEAAGICHSFSPDGRCVSLLKILLSNECIYDCKYCLNRVSNDRVRTTFTPDEICTLVVEFYRRNYIEGLFLSSGIVKSPTYTMELMYQAIYLLRTKYHFNGYIHVKAIPGTSDELITNMGYLVDRMSVNLELPTIDGLKKLAPHKNPKKLVAPIRQIQNGIVDHRSGFDGCIQIITESRISFYIYPMDVTFFVAPIGCSFIHHRRRDRTGIPFVAP